MCFNDRTKRFVSTQSGVIIFHGGGENKVEISHQQEWVKGGEGKSQSDLEPLSSYLHQET